MVFGTIFHEMVHAGLLVASTATIGFSLLRFRKRRTIVLGSFWAGMAVLSAAVLASSVMHVASSWNLFSFPEHIVHMGVLLLLASSLIYYSIALDRFQERVVSVMEGSLEPMSLISYLGILALLGKGTSRAIAYHLGRNFAEKLFEESRGNLDDITRVFGSKTGVRMVLVEKNSAAFFAKASGGDEADVLGYFIRGFWEKLVMLTEGRSIKANVRTRVGENTVEIVVTG